MRKFGLLLLLASFITGCGAFHRSGDNNPLPAFYSVEEIPLSEGDWDEVAVDINDEGEVAYVTYIYEQPPGASPARADGPPAATQRVKVYFYSKGQPTARAAINVGFYWLYRIDVNNAGQAIIYSGSSSYGLYLDQDSTNEIIPFPNSTYSHVYDINDLGQIVGESNYRGFLWESGNAEVIEPEGFIPFGINNLGQMVGKYQGKAQLWKEGTLTELGVLPGCFSSCATAINENGQVVGYSVYNYSFNEPASGSSSKIAPPGEGYKSFIWQNGVMTEIGGSQPLDINDAGIVVGGGGSAFVYCDGKRENLADMVPPDSGWTFEEAQAINNDGWIVGKGRYNGHLAAFLLKPQY